MDAKRAGAILYGDLGTSKAYVIGLAFAAAGYSSFWLILAVSLLLVLVGINYVVICRCYPHGGGVYTSVRQRSHILSLVAGFFLIADFVVTAALSAQSAFSYFQVEAPVIWTVCILALIGVFNYFGPRSTGKQAFIVFIFAFLCLFILAIFSIPFLGQAVSQLQPLSHSFAENWKNFVGVIVALSGIEVIANMTGIMKLDPLSTKENPSVNQTAKKAIFWVVTEVALFTSFFSLASMALKGITIKDGQVFAGSLPIRDAWLRYLGETFIGQILGDQFGIIFGWILSIAIAILLFSAVNTAITGLVSILYVISHDGELPKSFQKLNRLGVPIWPLIIATAAPIVIILFIHDIAGLAHLYAIGFVGAIATNLIATGTDRRLPIKPLERGIMFFTFFILFLVEVTLFIDKPAARNYILVIVLIGLLLRGLTLEAKERKKGPPHPVLPPSSGEKYAILCAVNKAGAALHYALKHALEKQCALYLLFIREQRVIFSTDAERKWQDDKQAKELFEKISQNDVPLYFYYAVSDYPPATINHYAKLFDANEVIIGIHYRYHMVNLIHENQLKELRKSLPKKVPLLIIPDDG